MGLVQKHLEGLRDNIKKICSSIGRDPHEVTLVGVTKYATIEQVAEALRSGLGHVAENRVQEAQVKFLELESLGVLARGGVMRHLIGHLQTNKVKAAVKIFDLIQSVDRLDLAQAIEKQVSSDGRIFDVLIQVNCSGEPQKSGVAPLEALKLVESVSLLSHVRIKGLMTMAALTEDRDEVRRIFRDLRCLRDQVVQKFAGHPRVEMKYLSMGMTHDYPIALEEGANMIRVGSGIFRN